MSEQTDAHNWIIPTVGGDEGEWGQILNDFIDGDLEDSVPIRDTLANRPAAGSDVPSLFVSTNEPALYYNNDTSWQEVSPPLTEEEVEDVVGALVTGGSGITASYDDGAGTLTISLASHGSTHEKGGADAISTFADTEHDSISNSDYHEPVDTANVTGTTSVDLGAFNIFDYTLTGDTTFEFLNPSTDPQGNSFTLYVRQDSTGGWTLTWPASVSWHGGSIPSAPASGEVLELTFRTPNGGSDWFGTESGRFTI